eukprot:SAG31_NODE_2177_length_6252_cov_4.841378_5_plen_69_part_00
MFRIVVVFFFMARSGLCNRTAESRRKTAEHFEKEMKKMIPRKAYNRSAGAYMKVNVHDDDEEEELYGI